MTPSVGEFRKYVPAKKHHYVPVFYQKGFADIEGLVWVYDRKLKRYKHLHPRSVCFSEDLYAIRRDGASRDRRVETDILSPIENASAPIFRRLGPDADLTDVEINMLSFFIGLQNTRLPLFAKMVSASWGAYYEQRMRLQFATVERATRLFESIEADTGEKMGVTAAEMVDSILNKRISFVATEIPFLQQMVEMAYEFGRAISRSEWTVLTAPQCSAFITSDAPFTVVPPKGSKLEYAGFGLEGSIGLFPFSRRYCVQLRHVGFSRTFRKIDAREVRVINHNLAANSERFVIGSNRRLLEAVVNGSRSEEMDPGQRFSIDVVVQNEEEALLKFTVHPRRYFYP